MVKDLVWGKILSVGVDEIDEDHRKLIHIMTPPATSAVPAVGGGFLHP